MGVDESDCSEVGLSSLETSMDLGENWGFGGL